MECRNILDRLLGQKTKVKILRYLVKQQDEQSGRRIAHETGINHWQCHNVLQELYREGILIMRRIGNSHLFSLKRDNYLVEKSIVPLFQVESSIHQKLVEELAQIKNTGIISLVLFGSIAKGKEKSHSDIDVLVVIKEKPNKEKIAEKIMERNNYYFARYGNTLSPYIVTEGEFRLRYKKGSTLIKNIIKDGKVVFGKTIGELIKK